jgi:hypothetical protein
MKYVEWEDDEYIVCVIVTHWQLSQKNSDETCWMRRYCLCKCYTHAKRIVMKHVEWEDDEYIVCVIVTLTQKNSDETCWMRRWWTYCLCKCYTQAKRIVMKHVEWEDIVCVNVTHTLKRIVMKYVEWEDMMNTLFVWMLHTDSQKNSDETCWMRRWWIYCLCNCYIDSEE